jgi:hypothetical protein
VGDELAAHPLCVDDRRDGIRAALARADDEARNKEALAACDSNQVSKGIEILAGLWVETLNSTYLYNQGRCYQKGGMSREAIGRFNEFIRVAADRPPDDPNLVAKARRIVKELEQELRSSAPGAGATVEPEQPTANQAQHPAPGADPGLAEKPLPLGWQRTTGYAVGAAGLATAGVGAFLAITGTTRGADARNRFINATTGEAWDRAKADFQDARSPQQCSAGRSWAWGPRSSRAAPSSSPRHQSPHEPASA